MGREPNEHEGSTSTPRLSRPQRVVVVATAAALGLGLPLVWFLGDRQSTCPTDTRKLENVFPITILNDTSEPIVIADRSTGELGTSIEQSSFEMCSGYCNGNRLPVTISPNETIKETAVCSPNANMYTSWSVETTDGGQLGDIGVATSNLETGLELKTSGASFAPFEPAG